MMFDLPVAEALPSLTAALRAAPNAVLVAPPGAGKTTLVPLVLKDEPWAEGSRILVLEPRRVAARAAARRMADMLGEGQPGGTIGLATRLDRLVSERTRIEVVTEGLLVRRLQSDPGLEGVAAVLFDEAHERNLDTDLALALCLDLQANLRPELRLLAMSATLDGAAFARLMSSGPAHAAAPSGAPAIGQGPSGPIHAAAPSGAPAIGPGDAPVIESLGRAFPVEIRHRARDLKDSRELPEAMAGAIRDALRDHPGDVLAFLPGWGEIRRTQERLAGLDALVVPLHGELPPAEQDIALNPAPDGRRKVVLATSIAETSLTVPGVRIVVDGGFRRAPRLDAATGLSRLATLRIGKAAAEQRAGRAGRQAPGVAIRLWTEALHRGLPQADRPEMLEAELSSLVLDCAAWGADPATLAFLDLPPPGAVKAAQALLRDLDALDVHGRITEVGRRMARLGTHPRLARMMLAAADDGERALAADLAALLEERDPIRGRDAPSDIHLRLDLLHGRGRSAAFVPHGGSASAPHGRSASAPHGGSASAPHGGSASAPHGGSASAPHGGDADAGAIHRIRRAAALHRRRLRVHGQVTAEGDAGALLAAGFPDRIAAKRGAMDGAFRLASGQGARLPVTDRLARAPLLAVADLELQGTETRIRMAAPIDRAVLESRFPERLRREEGAAFDARAGAVVARRRLMFGPLVLEESTLPHADPAAVAVALADAAAERALRDLNWTDAARQVQARIGWMRRVEGDAWPDLSDAALVSDVRDWLAPHLHGRTRLAELGALDVTALLLDALPWERRRALDAALPARIALPGGRSAAIDYARDVPTLEARAQHLFGLAAMPPLAGGRVPLQVALLSPAGRPVAVTGDLAGFWKGGWADVRRDMRGRYPKHAWPEDPAAPSG